MKITPSKLKPTDLDAVDKLMKRNSRTLGFLPRAALRHYLETGGVGAKTDDGQLIGYLLYAAYPDRFRVAQLCVAANFRGQGIAKQLVEALKNSATTQKVIKLHCRRDFPAHNIWPELRFVPLDERPGRSKDGQLLTLWCLTLASDDQLSLFQAKTSDETLDVIIDAQVFFDFYESGDNSKPSKALLSDFLIDSLDFWITDELFNEIDRNNDPKQREKLRHRAQEFLTVKPEPYLVETFDKLLREFLPSRRPSQESDVRQLAKAAASSVKTFVTRDRDLLKKSERIAELTGLHVLSPVSLIIRLHELSERQSYAPDRISGLQIRWQRFTSEDLSSFPFTSFLDQGERQGQFREKLELFLASPDHYECELLWSGNDIVVIRVLANGTDKALTIHLGRVVRSPDRSLFQCFLVADTVEKAVAKDLGMVKFEKTLLAPSLIPTLLKTGFTECHDSFVRFCFARCLDRGEVLSEISELCPESAGNYQDMSDLELERHCSPLSLEEAKQEYFLIPVRPGYAISLIDRFQSGSDLFGGDPTVLLRWNNVYYRKKTLHKTLKCPGRILWYVSTNKREIIAISHLDAVEIDTSQKLYRRFKKFGILGWKALYEMCKGDLSKELMALQFSHTFLFRKPIPLKTMRTVYEKEIWLQGPSRIPPKTFHELFQLGYPTWA